MTAFEILMADFYDNLVENEPKCTGVKNTTTAKELHTLVKCYIDASFAFGHIRANQNSLRHLITRICGMAQESGYEEWQKLKSILVESDLHQIRHGRHRLEVQMLKTNLTSNI